MYILLILLYGGPPMDGWPIERIEGIRTLAACEEAAKMVKKDFVFLGENEDGTRYIKTSCIRVKDGSDE